MVRSHGVHPVDQRPAHDQEPRKGRRRAPINLFALPHPAGPTVSPASSLLKGGCLRIKGFRAFLPSGRPHIFGGDLRPRFSSGREGAWSACEAAGKASAELAAAREELAGLRAQVRKSEAEHAARVADLQQQIKAMALKVPTGGGGGTVVQPGTRTPATESGIERRIGSGQ